ncbi:hypothetical protein PILCRDRAFT_132038 [Piloderma croceum F 1598]|uniref:Uncharacterized protein n=1 Tax=Piloderma croceum (strain F 1598) TaxID=765440 RepID=A0A0C3CP59_PILCF|nr:hypothetical protein PILCRDRAFT_132038 [Piloderma croceum F 1598]
MLQLFFAISCLLCMGLSYSPVYNPYSHLKSIFSHHTIMDFGLKLEKRKLIALAVGYTFAGTEFKAYRILGCVAWITSVFVRIRVFHQTHSLSVHSSSIFLLFFIFLIFEVLAAC